MTDRNANHSNNNNTTTQVFLSGLNLNNISLEQIPSPPTSISGESPLFRRKLRSYDNNRRRSSPFALDTTPTSIEESIKNNSKLCTSSLSSRKSSANVNNDENENTVSLSKRLGTISGSSGSASQRLKTLTSSSSKKPPFRDSTNLLQSPRTTSTSTVSDNLSKLRASSRRRRNSFSTFGKSSADIDTTADVTTTVRSSLSLFSPSPKPDSKPKHETDNKTSKDVSLSSTTSRRRRMSIFSSSSLAQLKAEKSSRSRSRQNEDTTSHHNFTKPNQYLDSDSDSDNDMDTDKSATQDFQFYKYLQQDEQPPSTSTKPTRQQKKVEPTASSTTTISSDNNKRCALPPTSNQTNKRSRRSERTTVNGGHGSSGMVTRSSSRRKTIVSSNSISNLLATPTSKSKAESSESNTASKSSSRALSAKKFKMLCAISSPESKATATNKNKTATQNTNSTIKTHSKDNTKASPPTNSNNKKELRKSVREYIALSLSERVSSTQAQNILNMTGYPLPAMQQTNPNSQEDGEGTQNYKPKQPKTITMQEKKQWLEKLCPIVKEMEQAKQDSALLTEQQISCKVLPKTKKAGGHEFMCTKTNKQISPEEYKLRYLEHIQKEKEIVIQKRKQSGNYDDCDEYNTSSLSSSSSPESTSSEEKDSHSKAATYSSEWVQPHNPLSVINPPGVPVVHYDSSNDEEKDHDDTIDFSRLTKTIQNKVMINPKKLQKPPQNEYEALIHSAKKKFNARVSKALSEYTKEVKRIRSMQKRKEKNSTK